MVSARMFNAAEREAFRQFAADKQNPFGDGLVECLEQVFVNGTNGHVPSQHVAAEFIDQLISNSVDNANCFDALRGLVSRLQRRSVDAPDNLKRWYVEVESNKRCRKQGKPVKFPNRNWAICCVIRHLERRFPEMRIYRNDASVNDNEEGRSICDAVAKALNRFYLPLSDLLVKCGVKRARADKAVERYNYYSVKQIRTRWYRRFPNWRSTYFDYHTLLD